MDGRFARRVGRDRGVAILGILLAVVALRAAGLAGRVDAGDAYVAELGLVAVLAFVVAPSLLSSPPRAALALLVGGAVATGSVVAPWTTVVVLAFLHNATPVGFLAERLAGTPSFRPALRAAAILFLAVPAFLATGLLARGFASLGLAHTEVSFGSVGPLAEHLRVFVPTEWVSTAAAAPLFTAAAYLQLLHYGAVIGVLPRLLDARGTPGDAPAFPWPSARVLAAAIAAVGALAAFGFLRDFAGTRAQYGLLASVHAWIEVPVLLLALAPRSRAPTLRSLPTA